MTSENGRPSPVTVTNWQACYNSGDGVIALSCSVTATDESATISGAGLILNDAGGRMINSFYAEFDGSRSVTLALNIPAQDELSVGADVTGVTTGEAGGSHFFVEESLKITNC